MNGNQCPSCGSAQPDGILCSDDTAAFETMLAAVPGLIDELQVSISKQAKIGSGGGKGGLARERSPINFGALAVRDALMVEMALWGDDVNAVRRHPQAAEIVSQFGRAVADAYRAIDRASDRQYLGTCMYEEDGATCHAELWARPDAFRVQCSQCETTHEVAERRSGLLARADDVIATVKQASEYLGEVGGILVNAKTIRAWIERGKLADYSGGEGERTIRLGDLFALLADKSEEKTRRAA